MNTKLVFVLFVFALLGCASVEGHLKDWQKFHTEVKITASCLECEAAIVATRLFVEHSPLDVAVMDVIRFFCEVLKIEDKNVCENVVFEFRDMFMYILINDALSPTLACGALGYCPKPEYPGWNVTFDKPAPPVKPYPAVDPKGQRLYVLHFSDAHVDLQYTPGLKTDCGEPLCCRPPNPKGTAPNNTAGDWGDFHCDTPPVLYRDMLTFVKNTFNLSYAIFTGDVPPHDIWAETRPSTLAAIDHVYGTFKSILPKVPLFAAVGNHEGVPVNEFPTRDVKGQFDMSWLYTPLANTWGNWISTDAVQQAQFAGYYTALTPDGTRIVSLNTNLGCNPENWWMKIPSPENSDPDNQLHWFANVMQKAEAAGEMVYLIMHINPSEGDCGLPWWRNYYRITQRYQNNILGAFAGHTHEDIFNVMYTMNSTYVQPFLTSFYPGSVTPFSPENPGFRVYEIDSKTKALVNYYEYFLNLTLTNAVGVPNWMLEYSALKGYNLPDMSPQSWHSLSVKMGTDQSLLNSFLIRRAKGHSEGKCDLTCQRNTWCSLWNAPPGVLNGNICGK